MHHVRLEEAQKYGWVGITSDTPGENRRDKGIRLGKSHAINTT